MTFVYLFCVAQLIAVLSSAYILYRQGTDLMSALTDLQAAVTNEQTVEAGVITLLQTLSADLKAAIAANDPAALEAVVTSINTNAAALAAAVTANTPAS